MPFWLVDVKNIRGNDKLSMSDLIDIDSVSLTAHLNSSIKRTPSPVCERKQSVCSGSTSPCHSGSPLSTDSPVHHTPTQEDCVPSSSDCQSMSLSRSLSIFPPIHLYGSIAQTQAQRDGTSRRSFNAAWVLAVPAIKARNTLRLPVQWSINRARAIENKIVNRMGRRTPQEYVE
ncbi:uncharacterized protein ARMOST_06261 [Armillaria ostoyae]|uniref:Uncharacterized protein n=1 Tax=Armillaria ostoyae TaxID=47428 RepID=A0A284R2H9_ARMOS|nr:uncharacterized protein ARMOST_06261 [Armillaria ostoyae]